jgi:hypothetical protein
MKRATRLRDTPILCAQGGRGCHGDRGVRCTCLAVSACVSGPRYLGGPGVYRLRLVVAYWFILRLCRARSPFHCFRCGLSHVVCRRGAHGGACGGALLELLPTIAHNHNRTRPSISAASKTPTNEGTHELPPRPRPAAGPAAVFGYSYSTVFNASSRAVSVFDFFHFPP